MSSAEPKNEQRPAVPSRGAVVLVLALGIVIGRLSLALPAWAQGGGDAEAPAPEAGTEASPTHETLAVPEGQPRYLEAMRRELDSMGIDASAACAADDAERAHCVLHLEGEVSERNFEIRLSYSDVTDTIYVWVPDYLTAPSDGEHTDAVMRRMMELNWTMLLGKFEWDPSDGEVRLGTVLNTDSNFDRRAFRPAIRAVATLADRHLEELTRLSETGR